MPGMKTRNHSSGLRLLSQFSRSSVVVARRLSKLNPALLNRRSESKTIVQLILGHYTSDAAREVAGSMLADLFMPDRKGHSRIASFDGQQSLATWLRFIVSRRVINQGLLKWNSFERIDRVADVADEAATNRIEAAIRASRFEDILKDCFRLASESLTNRERLIVLLRYEEGLRVVEVAKVLNIHPSGVTRQLQRVHEKLQQKIVSVLAIEHHLWPAAIHECLVYMLENPEHSLLAFVRAWTSGATSAAVSNRR